MLSEKRNALRSLIESSDGVHLTAYLVNHGDTNDLRLQLTETLKNAADNLRPVLSRQDRTRFLKPIRAMLDDSRVLGTLRGNVGIFRAHNSFRVLHVPVDVEQVCSIATTFHVKPLLRWLQSDRDFLLVGIEKGVVHLYQGSQHALKHVDSLALSQDFSDVPLLRSRFSFWTKKDDTSKISSEVGHWLEDWLSTLAKHSKPKLFFAGRKNISDFLKSELAYRNIAKNPQWSSFKTKYLGKICAEIRNEIACDAEKYLERSFLEFQHANNLDLTESNIFSISKAAIQGRVKRLMIAGEINMFGKLNPVTGDLVLHKKDLDHEDDCVLDDLAQTVWAQGGKVVVASQKQIPGGHAVLAITDPADPEMRIKTAKPPSYSSKYQEQGASV